ncbi:MAG: penicillin-binding protein activator, partial [Gammaproteobacteria bacterium]
SRNIALLLPLSGRTAKQAQAIQDAILATHKLSSSGMNPIKTYDTANNIESIGNIYQRAVNDGADFIIGPLLKRNIRELASSVKLTTPVLALNRIEESVGFSQPVYQFGLNPGDEARQAAERARLDGRQRIVALVPDSPWGERVLAAFADSWQQAGGELMGVERYPARTTDFSQYIQRILNLDTSKQRRRSLERRLGQKLEFQARKRKDVDSVFIVAFPREARQITPQLRFHHANDLAVYATSHIYSGAPDATKDRDLNGIRFCDTPWTLGSTGESALRQQLERSWGKRASHYQRLFALGIDAYQLIPWLESSARSNQIGYTGTTGILTLDDNRLLHRRLDCAEFRKGLPDTLGTLPVTVTDNPQETIPSTQPTLRWSTNR